MLKSILKGTLAALLLAAGFAAMPAKALTLIENGQPNATIVIAKDAPYKNQLAARELQAYLKKISGAELPIVTDEQDVSGKRILVGRSRFTDSLKIAIPNGWSLEEIKEAYLLKTSGDSLILAGNDDGFPLKGKPDKARPYLLKFDGAYKGTLFAVYDFLERLGCRWFMPGEIGEVVPKMNTVKVDQLDIVAKPSFMFRGYWIKPMSPEANSEQDAFFHRNRFLEFEAGFSNANDGSLNKLFPEKKYFESNPEYYGLNQDLKTRNKDVICMSNPDVIKIVIEGACEYFAKNPDATYFGFAPADGQPACWCEKCIGLNGQIRMESAWNGGEMPCISGTYYNLINEVAKAIKPEFPGKIIAASIYAGRILPPPS